MHPSISSALHTLKADTASQRGHTPRPRGREPRMGNLTGVGKAGVRWGSDGHWPLPRCTHFPGLLGMLQSVMVAGERAEG